MTIFFSRGSTLHPGYQSSSFTRHLNPFLVWPLLTSLSLSPMLPQDTLGPDCADSQDTVFSHILLLHKRLRVQTPPFTLHLSSRSLFLAWLILTSFLRFSYSIIYIWNIPRLTPKDCSSQYPYYTRHTHTDLS